MLARVALEGEARWEDETVAASTSCLGACGGGGTLGDREEESPELS